MSDLLQLPGAPVAGLAKQRSCRPLPDEVKAECRIGFGFAQKLILLLRE